MKNAFVSYPRKDKALVEEHLLPLLDKHDVSTFLDVENLSDGEFQDQLRAAIENCDLVLVVITVNTLDSAWVKSEVNYAEEHNRQILPLTFDETSPSKVDLRLGNYQHYPMATEENRALSGVQLVRAFRDDVEGQVRAGERTRTTTHQGTALWRRRHLGLAAAILLLAVVQFLLAVVFGVAPPWPSALGVAGLGIVVGGSGIVIGAWGRWQQPRWLTRTAGICAVAGLVAYVFLMPAYTFSTSKGRFVRGSTFASEDVEAVYGSDVAEAIVDGMTPSLIWDADEIAHRRTVLLLTWLVFVGAAGFALSAVLRRTA